MKPTLASLATLVALCSVLPAPFLAQEAATPGLRRVAPGAQDSPAGSGAAGEERTSPDARAGDLPSLLKRGFDRARWSERLQDPVLEQREQAFDALLTRARLDPVARAYLEELARDARAGELAWTARLALRELGRAHFPLQGVLSGADLFGPDGRMQAMLELLQSPDGLGLYLTPPGSAAPPGPRGPQPGSAALRVQLEQGPDGVRLRIFEGSTGPDGAAQTRSYEGKDLAEILAAHPELEEALAGLRLRGPGARDPLLQRFLGGSDGLALVPQGRSRPVVSDRLGVYVEPLGAERARALGLEGQGLLVQRTYPQTYAHLLGVSAGDVLLELDGRVLRESGDIDLQMRARSAGDPLELVWIDALGQRRAKTWRPDQGR